MSEDNVIESAPVAAAVEVAVVTEHAVQEAPKTIEEKFEALVKLLADHGIHLR